MGHRFKIFLRQSLLLFLGILPAHSLFAAESSPAPASTLNRITQMIEHVRSSLTADHTQKQSLHQELQNTQKDLHAVSSQLKVIHANLASQHASFQKLKKIETNYLRDLQHNQKILGQQIQITYQWNHYNTFDLLLNQQDPAQLNRSLHYLRYFNQARFDHIVTLRQTIAHLKLNQEKIITHKETLESLLAARKKNKNKLLQVAQVKQQMLGKVNTRIQTNNEQLSKLLAEKHALEKILKNLAQQKYSGFPQSSVSFSRLMGKLIWPTTGKVTQHFGTQIDTSGLKYTGILIRSPRGQDIRAVYPGRVVFADWLQGFGRIMIIDHGNNYMTLYGHNQKFYKQVGENVQAGDQIASVGSNGDNALTGLYFEIRYQGHPSNPEGWLERNSA